MTVFVACRRALFRWALAGLLALTLAFGLQVAKPSQAEAVLVNYSCGVLNPQQWCLYATRHTYTYGEAEYPGAGNLTVCTKFIYDATNGDYVGPVCGWNFISLSGFTPVSYTKPLVQNGSYVNNHTVWGAATY